MLLQGEPHDAAVNFDTYQILQWHRATLTSSLLTKGSQMAKRNTVHKNKYNGQSECSFSDTAQLSCTGLHQRPFKC